MQNLFAYLACIIMDDPGAANFSIDFHYEGDSIPGVIADCH
ncbi:MAG: hypothetical protein P4L51_22455 [Puia sp.]|nr:hypothetical protein [Puia sp.]